MIKKNALEYNNHRKLLKKKIKIKKDDPDMLELNQSTVFNLLAGLGIEPRLKRV